MGLLHFLSFSAFGGGTASNVIMAFASLGFQTPMFPGLLAFRHPGFTDAYLRPGPDRR